MQEKVCVFLRKYQRRPDLDDVIQRSGNTGQNTVQAQEFADLGWQGFLTDQYRVHFLDGCPYFI